MLLPIANLVAIAGVFGVGLLIGLVVLTSAESSVQAVARAAAKNVSGSFWLGIVVQVAAVPLLVLLLLACVLTIVGILITPLVALAWALAMAGALTLGVLGVAIMMGRALVGRGSNQSERAASLRGLVVGLTVLGFIWASAAVASPVPVAGALARLLAVAFTWAVATVGLGAVLRSRLGLGALQVRMAGFRTGGFSAGGFSGFGQSAPSSADISRATAEVYPASWATPTPIPGVIAAAKRPTDGRPDSAPNP
jgi:hypothetical protein